MPVETATSKRSDSKVSKSDDSPSQESRISIWFFIGVLLLVYGLLILGAGIHDLLVPPEQQLVLANLHAGIWWGGLVAVLGGIYSYRFSPRKER